MSKRSGHLSDHPPIAVADDPRYTAHFNILAPTCPPVCASHSRSHGPFQERFDGGIGRLGEDIARQFLRSSPCALSSTAGCVHEERRESIDIPWIEQAAVTAILEQVSRAHKNAAQHGKPRRDRFVDDEAVALRQGRNYDEISETIETWHFFIGGESGEMNVSRQRPF